MEKAIELDLEEEQPKATTGYAQPGDRANKPLCFDIETYKWEERPLIIQEIIEKKTRSYVKPDIIEKYRQNALDELALDPITGQIILAGFYDGKEFFHLSGLEHEIIVNAVNFLVGKMTNGYKLVTKGGKRFDLPYLLTRAAVHSLSLQFPYSYKDIFGKYNSFYHVDIENIFESHSLGTLAHAFGISPEPGNRGNEIAKMYEENDLQAIVAKNSDDLKTTFQIYERIKWANL